MIDFEEFKSVVRERIYTADIFGDSIQWENVILSDDDKGSLWMSEAFLPASETFSTDKSDVLEGILSYSIMIPVGVSETIATNAGKELGGLFSTLEVIETINYKTSITSISRSAQGKFDNAWYTVVIDLNFKQYNS